MINDKRLFSLSIFFFLLTILFVIPFPNQWSLGETMFRAVGLPVLMAGGLELPGIFCLGLLIAGMTCLMKSLETHRGLAAVTAIALLLLVPGQLVNSYQNTFARGINAISYDESSGSCRFEMKDEDTLQRTCSLTFQNHSYTPVTFSVDFQEDRMFPMELPMASLMNQKGPFDVTLQGKEQRREEFEADIDVSRTDSHIDNGEVMDVDVKITVNGKSREL